MSEKKLIKYSYMSRSGWSYYHILLAVKATPKAMIRIRSDSMINHDGNPDGYTKKELIESAWICFVPAVVVGTSTIACIFGANILNKRQQASLASAYALVSNQYRDYKSKLKELYGEEAHNKIVDEIVKEKAKDICIMSWIMQQQHFRLQ